MAASSPRADWSAASSHPERTWHYDGWLVAFASAVGIFCWSLPPFSFAVFLKPISDEFGWSRQSVSALIGVSAMVSAICSAPIGYLIDRVGARRVVLPSLAAAGLVFASRAFLEPPFWHLVVLFGLSGLVGMGTSPVAYGRLLASWFDERRGQALGFAIAGGALGAMVHPPLAQALIDAGGWRSAHLVLGGVMLVLGLPIALRYLTPYPSGAGPRQGRDVAAGATVREALGSRLFWILAVVLLCDSIANSSLTVHLPALLLDRGVSAGQSALALSALGGAAFLGRLSSGWMLDRWFGPYLSVGLLMLSTAGLLVLTTAQTAVGGAVAAALVGFGMGGEADVTPYLLTRYFGLRSFSTLYGVMFMATAIAWGIGPALMGRAYDASGSYTAHLEVLGAMLLVAAVLMLVLPRYPPSLSEVSRGPA